MHFSNLQESGQVKGNARRAAVFSCRWLRYRNAAVSRSAAIVSDSFCFGPVGAYTVPVTYSPTRTYERGIGRSDSAILMRGALLGAFPAQLGKITGMGVQYLIRAIGSKMVGEAERLNM